MSAAVTLCVFCNERPMGSVEHVVLEALGGRRTTPSLLCGKCNNGFGGGVDSKLEGALRFFSAVTGCFRGDGEPVAPARVQEFATPHQLSVAHGGQATRTKQVEITMLEGDGTSSVKAMGRFDEAAIAGFVASTARAKGIGFDEIGLDGVVRLAGVAQADLSGGFGGPDQFRCVAKMGLAAEAYGKALRRCSKTDSLAQWVAKGAGNWRYALDPHAGPAFRASAGVPIGRHLLAVFCGPTSHWEAAFVAFGAIVYRVELPRPSRNFVPVVHIVDPVGQTHDVRAFHPPALRPIQDLVAADEHGQVAIDELVAWVEEAAAAALARHGPETQERVPMEAIREMVRAHLSKP